MSASGPSSPPSSGGTRVLFVDDEQQLVTVTARLLERQGFRVKGFVDAPLALETLRADPWAFDVLVTDLNMPALSGLQVAAQAHALRAELPVVLTSGYVTEELMAQAAAAGIAGVCAKPSSLQVLIQAIRDALAGLPLRAPE